MPDALQAQLLTALTSFLARQPAPGTVTTQDMWQLLTTLIDEIAERSSAPPGPIWLEWQFDDNSNDSQVYELDPLVAGTYVLAGQTNCARVGVLVNGRPVSLPFTAKVGEQVALTIERVVPGAATVQLLGVGSYRQLVAASLGE